MGTTSYAIALGSNRRHGRHGDPRRVVEAAIASLADAGLVVSARSAIRASPAMGGAGRCFANAAVTVDTGLAPLELLHLLKCIERQFGRRPARRWAPRVLDLDILLCSRGGRSLAGTMKLGSRLRGNSFLSIPHPGLTTREFVLRPLEEIAAFWRHPANGHRISQLRARLHRPQPVDRSRSRP